MEKEYQDSSMTPERSDSVCKQTSLDYNSVSEPKPRSHWFATFVFKKSFGNVLFSLIMVNHDGSGLILKRVKNVKTRM